MSPLLAELHFLKSPEGSAPPPHQKTITIAYRWMKDSESDTREGLNFLFVGGLCLTLMAIMGTLFDSQDLMSSRCLTPFTLPACAYVHWCPSRKKHAWSIRDARARHTHFLQRACINGSPRNSLRRNRPCFVHRFGDGGSRSEEAKGMDTP